MPKKKQEFANIIDTNQVDEEEVVLTDNDLISNIDENQDLNRQEKPRKVTVSKGLTYDEVKQREILGQVNKTVNKNVKTTKSIILKNVLTIFNFLNILIAVALIVSGNAHNILFLPIVIINTIIGVVQEIKAKNTIDNLSLVSAPSVQVIRNGHQETISSDQVVIDDILYFSAGKQIVADCVVRKGTVEVNESLLTGEADNIVKKPGSLLYSGSYIVSGECYAKVERVGNDSYINQLSGAAKKYTKPKSEIMDSLGIFIKVITVCVVILGPLLFFVNFKVNTWQDSVNNAASSMIGMIPSGLFLMTSLSLAIGVVKLGKRKTLVQDLYCIEMLARVDVLCLDKTGTITDGTMKVKETLELNADSVYTTKQIISFILGSTKETNATAVALDKKFGHIKKGFSKNIIPFSSVRKLMAAYDEETNKSYIIGAPEYILGDAYPTSTIAGTVEKYARQGLRVLLLASSPSKIYGNDQDFADITPLTLITIEDVIKKDAIETIQYFKDSNVLVKVISGDNPITVSKIAQRVGIDRAERCISLEGMSDEEVAHVAMKYTVFGRVSPKQKQIIIKTIKEKGHTVAMTGDGVNDILALKEADCGIAMANGSEAARDVAHLVLLDSNFSSMPYVVQEGRRVINNIKSVATMYLTKTLFSFFLTLIAVCTDGQYPIEPSQLNLYDWFVVSIPSLYLAIEPNNKQISGKFLKDVILSALPGALIIILDFAIIKLVGGAYTTEIFGAGDSVKIIHTLTALSITFVGFMILFKRCKPFTRTRATLYVIMLVLFGICLASLHQFSIINLDIEHMNITSTLLLISITLCSIFLYKALNKAIDFVKNKEWEKYIK